MQIGKGSVSTFKAIYGNDNYSSVAEIGHGSGKVIYIGEDYFSFGYATDWGEGTHEKVITQIAIVGIGNTSKSIKIRHLGSN